jgi:hypothetical protein
LFGFSDRDDKHKKGLNMQKINRESESYELGLCPCEHVSTGKGEVGKGKNEVLPLPEGDIACQKKSLTV